ncbi:hypothetical protein [Guptibacillus hwajinpoensis]|uniref:hypothetical protein n=1 Tax=Guptibacillus hwajinpoensis TaxID=208199 RepID=UPI001CFDC7E2|nr:hypothetical protein [Pseudalkalibacillus hwajinpoensis]WLR61502.1 hypothetical protein LC071_09540 [Pseudalkalibacillus hwajinpoensis]
MKKQGQGTAETVSVELFKEISEYVQRIERKEHDPLSTQSAIYKIKSILLKHLFYD